MSDKQRLTALDWLIIYVWGIVIFMVGALIFNLVKGIRHP